ncbi:myoneurin-like isoform X1 [Nymphalis io]|uniref:myoneurin-like isoform X1 n=1 Tax=Inachis io TaxID=171585 RepID=UPI002166E943|nr:myoneurin-like isoform X1 [Nymphalis io]
MSVEIWNLEKDLCRCCHTEGSFDNLAEPKTYLEKVEIYSDMLRDCFDIEIAPVPGELCTMTYKICEACILRLRYAVTFKKQVQDCEERFMELYYKNAIKALNNQQSSKSVVKEELSESFLIDLKEEDISQMDHHDEDDEDEDDDDDFDLKEDEDEQNSDEDILVINKQKLKTKEKLKIEKPKMKRGRPRKIKEEKRKEAVKEKKGDDSTRSFRLQAGDYRRDGDKFACCRCEKIYDKMCSLRFHIKTKHYKIPRFTCQYCMKGFMTHAPFTIHKLEDHNIDERYYCKACKGTFNTKIQLRKHINNFHMLGERYQCDLCDYESFSFEGMYKHKFKHKTSKDYHCRFCRKSFLRKTTLDLHERIHTGDRRKVCKICSQAFVQKASLNYHMTKYHPDVNF